MEGSVAGGDGSELGAGAGETGSPDNGMGCAFSGSEGADGPCQPADRSVDEVHRQPVTAGRHGERDGAAEADIGRELVAGSHWPTVNPASGRSTVKAGATSTSRGGAVGTRMVVSTATTLEEDV